MFLSLQDAFLDGVSNITSMIYRILPNLFGSILVFVVGIILAKWIKTYSVKLLDSVNISKLTKNTDIEKFLKNADFKSRLEDIIGSALKWTVLLIFSVAAVNVLGIPTISDVLNQILNYIPRIVAAILVLGLGVFLAGVVEKLVKGAASQIDQRTGRMLGKIASYTMVVFTAMAAFNELGIAAALINILFIGLVAMLALGFGLALGLGAKDLVSTVLMDWYKKFKNEMEGK